MFKEKFIILVAGLVIVGATLFFYLLQPPKISENKVFLKIADGYGLEEITTELKNKNLIRSEIVFKIYSVLSGNAQRLKPGGYDLDKKFSIPELINLLASGPKDVLITITPGMTVAEIDDKLSSVGIIEPGELIDFDSGSLGDDYPWLNRSEEDGLTKNKIKLVLSNKGGNTLEGFLFPDSYYFSPQSSPKIVVRKILDNFKAKALPFFDKYDNLAKVITLASLLEKEAPDFYDRQIIVGILEKRLKAGMPLQVDAAVVYAKCGGRFWGCPILTKTDFKIDSPHNTYLYKGLPLGPIGSPELEAIKAVLSPKASEYWYYLSDPQTKKTIFSKTLDEQNKNRAKYLLSEK